MPRPRKSMEKNVAEIREELFNDLEECSNTPFKKHPAVKNVYNYHPDCPYAAQNTGIVLESHYQYWRFYPKDIIQSDETIGHLNNDRTDNRIENLVKRKKQKQPEHPVAGHMPVVKRD